MINKLDTSWFSIKNYEGLKTMSIKGWIWQLESREYYYKLCEKDIPSDNDFLFISTILKKGVIPESQRDPYDMIDGKVGAIIEDYSFATVSVNSLCSYDIWNIANEKGLSLLWDACKHTHEHFMTDKEDSDLFELAYTPHDVNTKDTFFDYWKNAHLVIDLSATDEQIKRDFNHWLRCFRKEMDCQHKKKLITQADFDHWIKYGVMAYIDLKIIAKIEGKQITNNELARMIFPDDFDVDIVERIRKVTKPTAEFLLKKEIYKTLSTQLVNEKVSGIRNP